MQIYKVPPVLFLNLKRFKQSSGSYYKDKLDDVVDFPITDLDLSDKVLSNRNPDGSFKEQIIYDLYAISNHYGNMGFGHYTAYAKNHITGYWYDFDDSSVTKMSPDQLVTGAAYNLFYVRKDFYPDGNIDFEAIKNTINSTQFMEEMNLVNQ